MTLPIYSQRKESALESIGEVPKHWEIKRLRFLAHLNPSKSEVDLINDQAEVLFLPMEAIGDDGKFDRTQRKNLSDVRRSYTYFRDGDVAFAKITPCFENGKAAHLKALPTSVGFGSTELTVLRALPDFLNDRFLYLVTVSELFRDIGEASMYGAGGQKRVPDDFVRNFRMAWPPLEEQKQITVFLDHETAKIDALVAEQKRLIELLKEKRQAVISHAVTKGLDPNVPMKDSGVEWLGEAPNHWIIRKLKYISPRIAVGIVVNPSDYVSDEGLPFIYGAEISESGIDAAKARRISPHHSQKNQKTMLREADLLTVRVGEPGVTATVPKSCEGGNCASVMLTRRGNFSSEWLCHVMNSRVVRHQVSLVEYGAAQKQFNISDAIEFQVAMPPLNEQVEIASYLSEKIIEIDNLMDKAGESIDLLEERRSALISAAVTGKIDVRDWQPSESANGNEHALPMAAEERARYG